MVDRSRWKPILGANQHRSVEEVLFLRPWSQDGWPSFLLAIYLITSFVIQTVTSPLSLTFTSQYFFLVILLTFLHQNRGPLVYAYFVQESHEPWAYGHILLIFFPIITSPHFITSHCSCSSSSSWPYLLLVFLRLFFTLSGDPSYIIAWKVVISFPLPISRTLIQRSLVQRAILLERVCLDHCLRVYPFHYVFLVELIC